MAAFARRTLLVSLLAAFLLAGKALVPKNGIARVPFDVTSISGVFEPQISDNGRWLAFRTTAQNFVEGGSDQFADIFAIDIKKGDIEQVSRTISGGDPEGSCQSPVISPTGRFIAYRTSAPNIIEGDETSTNDLFLFDRIKKTTKRVSTNVNGGGASIAAMNASISKNGRWVVFSTAANHMVDGDVDSSRDVFLRDMKLGVTTILSTTSAGEIPTEASDRPRITPNGRYVAFDSQAALVPEDDNGTTDVYLRDLKLGTLKLASVSAGGEVANGATSAPDISANGRWLSFTSLATNLVPGDEAFISVYRRDMKKNTIELVNADAEGNPSIAIASTHAISPDGRFVVFGSLGTDLGPADLNTHRDLYLKDTKKGTVERLTVGFGGVETDDTSSFPQASKKAKFIAFESLATNLVDETDDNPGTDIFVARP